MEDKKQIPKIDWKKLVGKCKDLCHRKDRLLIILLTGILLLVIAVPFSGEGDAETGLMHSGKTKDPSDNTSNEMAGNGNAETYADYLEQNNYQIKRIAVELNEEILPKYSYSDTMLKDGDRLEVVTFVGGG